MKPNTIVSIFIVVLVFIFIFLFGFYAKKGGNTASVQGATSVNSQKSSLVASEVFYDFGTISMKDGDVTKEFTVTNPTASDVTLKTVLTSCMCTTAFIVAPDGGVKGPFKMPGMGYVSPADEIIKASESRVIRVVYDPNAHGPAGVGMIDRFVNLTDSEGGELQLEIKALVKP